MSAWPIWPDSGPTLVRVVVVFVLMFLGVQGIFALNRRLKRPPDKP